MFEVSANCPLPEACLPVRHREICMKAMIALSKIYRNFVTRTGLARVT